MGPERGPKVFFLISSKVNPLILGLRRLQFIMKTKKAMALLERVPKRTRKLRKILTQDKLF